MGLDGTVDWNGIGSENQTLVNHGMTLKHLEQIFVLILFISATGCSIQVDFAYSHETLLSLFSMALVLSLALSLSLLFILTSRRALTAQWVQTRSTRDESRTSIGQYLGFRLQIIEFISDHSYRSWIIKFILDHVTCRYFIAIGECQKKSNTFLLTV